MPSQIVQVKARTVVRQGTLPPLFAGRVRQLYYKLLDEGTVVVTYTFLSPHSAPATRELLVEAADVERGNAPRDENIETDDAYRTRWEAELLPILGRWMLLFLARPPFFQPLLFLQPKKSIHEKQTFPNYRYRLF